ncbi:MAG TPA: autotransporter assembly complex family protein [Xanthomonadales bacterium]|nr:autotransporter assembly complex family protein [Xanthomonadales bacterium]
MHTGPDRFRLAFVAALFLIAAPVRAARVDVRIEGLDDPLIGAVRGAVELRRYRSRDATPAQIRRLYDRAEGQIRDALEPFGYYEAKVDAKLEESPQGFVATFTVAPGEPVVVRKVDIEIADEAREQRGVRIAQRRFHPRVGEPLDHAAYENGKAQLQSALVGNGWLDAELTAHKVEVTAREHAADVHLAWDIGDRYRFGDVKFSGGQFEETFLARYVPWKDDEYYSQAKLLELQQRLVDADYFAIAEVAPDTEHTADGRVPISVLLAPAKRTVYTGGVFVSTDIGFGLRGGIDRRWVNKRGHKLDIDAEIAQRRRSLTSLYTIPKPGRDRHQWTFGISAIDEDTATSQQRVLRVGAADQRDVGPWTRTLGLQLLTGTFEVADERGQSTLLYPEVVFSRKEADSIEFPRRGWSLTGTARVAQEGIGSDTSLAQVRADGKWIRGIGRRNRFIARGTLGAMQVDDFSELPPELRFFAGGDRSIRGYGYQEIGPRNASGGVVGGKFLAVASAEFEHYFVRNWGAAVFVDAGDAFDRNRFDLRIGAGAGVRWRSPVGLVRLDLGVPVNDDFESGIELHLSIGPDL